MEFDNSLNTSRNILHSIIDRYKNHPSILKIKSEVSSKSCSDCDFSRNILLTSDGVEKMLKSLNSKKAAGTDRLPIKLVKLASEVLSKPFSIALLRPFFQIRQKLLLLFLQTKRLILSTLCQILGL